MDLIDTGRGRVCLAEDHGKLFSIARKGDRKWQVAHTRTNAQPFQKLYRSRSAAIAAIREALQYLKIRGRNHKRLRLATTKAQLAEVLSWQSMREFPLK